MKQAQPSEPASYTPFPTRPETAWPGQALIKANHLQIQQSGNCESIIGLWNGERDYDLAVEITRVVNITQDPPLSKECDFLLYPG